MFVFAFTPTEGIINNLLTNFTEYVFREKEDIGAYLDVLASTPQFLAECMELTKTQEAAGYFMTEAALEETLEQIDSFTGKKEDNQLIIIFDENIDAFAGLSDAEKEQYKQRNRDIVLNQYIPAYQKTGEELAAMKGSCRPTDAGLCSLQGGKEYYAAKARLKTSTDKTVEELLDECKAFVETTLEEYISIYRKNPAVISSDESVDLNTPEETLAYLQAHLQDYPEGPEVSYTAKYLDPSVANAGVVAYYLNPPVDDLKDNVIKINGASVGDSTKLYETLAHEGFPGHLYQITWYLNTKPARARYQLNMLGYTEGWAMYSEMRAYEFSGMSEDYARMCALDTALNYVLDCAVDLSVNGLGWTETEVGQMLDELGLNSSMAGDLVKFVTSDPAVLLPYGIGLLKFETMYADAKTALGDSFSLKEFHRVMLENGARPFDLVRADMNTWLESQGKTAPSPTPAKQTDWMPWMIGGALIAVLIIVFLAQRSFRKSA